MTREHTPGPWRWNCVADEAGKLIALHLETKHRPIACNDPVVFSVREDWMGPLARGMKQPDLSLIAAAPDMLEALKMVMQHGRIDNSEERLNIVAAAIAKAAP